MGSFFIKRYRRTCAYLVTQVTVKKKSSKAQQFFVKSEAVAQSFQKYLLSKVKSTGKRQLQSCYSNVADPHPTILLQKKSPKKIILQGIRYSVGYSVEYQKCIKICQIFMMSLCLCLYKFFVFGKDKELRPPTSYTFVVRRLLIFTKHKDSVKSRNSHLYVFCKSCVKCVLKSFPKYTRKYLYRNLFFQVFNLQCQQKGNSGTGVFL